ncbi:unnamed protein product [Brassica rapa subsp. narinosa]
MERSLVRIYSVQNVVPRTYVLITISYYVMGFVIEAFTSTVFNHLCVKKIFRRMMRVGYALDVLAKIIVLSCSMIL